jgi:hypothetical protein
MIYPFGVPPLTGKFRTACKFGSSYASFLYTLYKVYVSSGIYLLNVAVSASLSERARTAARAAVRG